MSSYFKMSNQVHELGLKANELNIYAYFCSLPACKTTLGDAVTVKLSTIAARCGYGREGTVKDIIDGLIERGLVERLRRFRSDRTTSTNTYIVKKLDTTKGYFQVHRKMFLRACALGKSSVAVLLYVLRCIDGKNECFPSLRTLAHALGMSISTITGCISLLERAKIVHKQRRRRIDGSFRHNCYIIIRQGTGRIKKMMRLITKRIIKVISKVIITKNLVSRLQFNIGRSCCQGFLWFLLRKGVLLKPQCIYKTHSYLLSEKEYL